MATKENKKTNSNSKNKNNKKNSPIASSLTLEITSIFIICFSIFLIVSIYFGGGGALGVNISKIFKGLLGFGAYILPIILIATSIFIFFKTTKQINIFKVVLSLMAFCFLLALFHISTKKDTSAFSNYFTYIVNEYKEASMLDGGVLGALVGDLFLKIIGKITSYIVLTILLIATICLLTGKSFFITLQKLAKKVINLFYYEYDIDEEYYEEEDELYENKKSIFSKVKDMLKNDERYSYKNDMEEKYYSHRNNSNSRYDRSYKNRSNTINRDNYYDVESYKYNIKRYNNYLFDGINKYKLVPKPVFFDMNQNKKCVSNQKIIFAIDEINNPQNYTKDIAKNQSINQNIINTTANIVNDFENTVNTNKNEENLFDIKPKDTYIKPKNEYLNTKKYTGKKEDIVSASNFNIDLKFSNQKSIEDIFENPPEQFLKSDVEEDFLNDLDDFCPFKDENTRHNIENYDNQNIEVNNNFEDIKNSFDYDDEAKNNISSNKQNEIIEEKNDEWVEIENKDYTYKPPIQTTKIDKSNEEISNLPKYSKKNVDNLNENRQNINEPVIIRADKEKLLTKNIIEEKQEYLFPKLSFLNKNSDVNNNNNDMELRENSYILIKTLKSFNVNAEVINISQGPSVTRYEIAIEDGIKVSKILGLADNLALSLAASSIRIEAPIPGKSAVGIEIPNKEVKSVFLSEVICSEKFQKFPSKVSFGLGKDITGNVIVTDIAKMPHMLIAGATGSGKSVCINTLITSILYKANPNDVKLMMIDPKVVELSVYNGIPHLLTPVVTEPEKASAALNWAVNEMMARYQLFSQTGTRNLVGYNELKRENNEDILPQIVIIIDELADLMMVAAKEVEESICRLAQLARAAGIHLIIATQRPSVDVITGLIKANIPSRIAFAVSSGTDSRTVLDTVGAEKLLGKGDMLFRSVDMNKPLRIQGAFISDKEVENIVTFIKQNSLPNYDENIINKIENSIKSTDNTSSDNSDELTEDVIAFLVKKGKASTSMIQRQFRIGYNRAARIIEDLEDRGIVSSENGSKQRDVLMDKYQYEEYLNRYDNY